MKDNKDSSDYITAPQKSQDINPNYSGNNSYNQ